MMCEQLHYYQTSKGENNIQKTPQLILIPFYRKTWTNAILKYEELTYIFILKQIRYLKHLFWIFIMEHLNKSRNRILLLLEIIFIDL